NIIQSDIYKNIDLLTGVTLNEGLYFAEYNIGNFYTIIPPDIIKTQDNINDDIYDYDEDDIDDIKLHRKTHVEQVLSYDPYIVLEQFSKLDYVERYINANFQFSKCYINEIRKRYEYPGKK
ncbi:unnamed protein product, partial [Rotaria sp. Silwood1]